jgi:hypothetical protein
MLSLSKLTVACLMALPLLIAAPARSHGVPTPDGIAPQPNAWHGAMPTYASPLAADRLPWLPAATPKTVLTTHPRLWLTSADLPRLKSWAVSTNPMYQRGLKATLNLAEADVNAKWNWTTGQPNPTWEDDGTSNWVGEDTEAYAEFFAFMSLVDPSASNRAKWASQSRTMLMWALNQAANCNSASQPFCYPDFITGNRMNYWGEAWGLTVDWIYPSLTATDKATIRKVYLNWANILLNVPNRSGTSPLYPGSLNDPRVLGIDATQSAFVQQNNQINARWAANNYFLGQARTLMLMAMAIDPADDPVVNSKLPYSAVGNSLGSFVNDGTGWWLYQIYAIFEPPVTAKNKLKLPSSTISLGLASGGLPVEGSLYGESQGFLAQTLLAMQTAGYTNTTTYGPQVGFLQDAYWDQAVDGFLHLLAPTHYIPPQSTGYTYQGQTWSVATYGDVLQTYVEPAELNVVGPLGIYDQATNNQTRLNADRWIAENALTGGPTKMYEYASGQIWGNSYATYAIMYFMLFDPAAATPTDPRPNVAKQFVAPEIGSVLARTDWSTTPSWFTYRCSWETINHESGDCGQFQFSRKGQWLVKEWSNYAQDDYAKIGMGYTPLYHNTLALQNTLVPTDPQNDEYYSTKIYGGQWNNGGNNGDPSTLISANDNWSYAQSNMTNLYNHPEWWTPSEAALAVTGASRSIVWLAPDTIVIYDRANSSAAHLFKNQNFVVMNKPQISGHTATVSGTGIPWASKKQELTIQSLLPTTATLTEQHFWTTTPSQEVNFTAALDTSYDRLVIQDPANPRSERFLTVLQGADSGTSAAVATSITSTGVAFQGAWVGNTAVMVPENINPAFTSMSYQVPGTVTQHMIAGLKPGTAYNIQTSTSGGTTTVTVSLGGSFVADVGGVISLGFPVSASPTIGGVVSGKILHGPGG